MKDRTVREVYDEFTDEQKKAVGILVSAAVDRERARDVFDKFTDEQKKVVYFIIGYAIRNGQSLRTLFKDR